MQQCRILSILLAEIKLKENEGTQRTSSFFCVMIETFAVIPGFRIKSSLSTATTTVYVTTLETVVGEILT